MFGRPQASAPQKDWSELYFHQKLLHVIDHTADWVFTKVNYWIPTVAVGMAASILLLGGPMAPGELMSLTLPTLSPMLPPTSFGQQMPERGPGGGDDDEEFEE